MANHSKHYTEYTGNTFTLNTDLLRIYIFFYDMQCLETIICYKGAVLSDHRVNGYFIKR